MFLSKEAMLKKIEYRINLLRARSEIVNERLINALIREARNLKNEENK